MNQEIEVLLQSLINKQTALFQSALDSLRSDLFNLLQSIQKISEPAAKD